MSERVIKPYPRAPRSCVENLQQQNNKPTGRRRNRRRNHETDRGHHGDLLKRNKRDCVRILCYNPNGIGFVSSERKDETIKMEKLKELRRDYDIDYVGLSEVNKDWRCCGSYDKSIWGATKRWTEHRRIQVGNNTWAPRDQFRQTGGTASMAFGDVVFRISDQGCDERKLGRWSHMTITGKNDLRTTIITGYTPCSNSQHSGSAYSQQLVYMASHPDEFPDDITCPRELFGHDLKRLVESRQIAGHQIILQGDFNAEYDLLEEWMLDLGLVDLIKKKHKWKGPRTCTKSKDSPIDAIFGSPIFETRFCGFLAFGRLLSDHRGLWIDIPKILLYGYNPPFIVSPLARRLKLDDPRVVEKYLTYLHSSMKDHNLFQRMDLLHSKTVYPLPQHLIEEYERIDELVNRLMEEAEEQCRKIRAGAIPWSPAFQKARRTVEYWERRRKHMKGEIGNTRYLIRLQDKLRIEYDPKLSMEEIETNIVKAYERRKLCKQEAESLSMEYRTELAMAKESAGNIKMAVHLRGMNRLEGIRRLFRNIRFMEGKIRGGSTTQVTVTAPDGTVREFTSRSEVEEQIIEENERKYHQTESGGCQLTDEVFVRQLGTHGNGPAVQSVLDGTYVPPPEASEETIEFLEACQYVDNVQSVIGTDNVITRYRNMVASWANRKEKTTSYHHHIGHYKAVMKDEYLSWFFFQRAEIPSISGYSPAQFRECIDLMILKRAMHFELTKQRTLGILDTQFNHMNKNIGYCTMRNAIALDSLATEQFSRPGRSAIDQCASKRFTIDHHQSRRLSFAMTSCDLAGCYDRIVHNAAALALLRVGISHAKIECMFGSIQRMTHRIRTAFGDSDVTYGGDDFGDWKCAPQGVLQGNASGPAVWSALSSIIFEILHKRGFGNQFCSALSKELFVIVGYSYVDDCDLFQSGEDPDEVLESMQRLINSWGSLMEVTGGALRPDKSWWYLVKYHWDRGTWKATDAGADKVLTAKGPDGVVQTLKHLDVSESAEMLGVWMSPSGDRSKLVSHLKRQAIDWAGKVRLGRASQDEAWTALTTNVSARLKYPLPCSTLSEKECKSIMFPAVRAALGKAGMASNMQGGIRDGPILDGGAGALSLFHYQGTSRVALLLDHCVRDTPTGKQLQICIEDLVMEIGMYGPLWNQRFNTYKKWTSSHSWIHHVCSYCNDNEITLNVKHAQLSPAREGDRAIMEAVSQCVDSTSTLRAVNRVRMHHGIIHLSDITSADGRKINEEFLASAEFDGRRNDYLWPVLHRVVPADYSAWRRTMEFVFCAGNLTLPTPLRAWKLSHKHLWLQHWDWFVSDDHSFLYRQIGENGWHRHIRRNGRGRTYHLEYLVMTGAPEGDIARATVTGTASAWTLCNTSSNYIVRDPTVRDGVTRRLDAITFHQPEIQWFMQRLRCSCSTSELYRHLMEGTAIIVSDGSYFPDYQVGACAWILATPDGNEWIEGGGLVPGPPEDQSAYRSELAGQLGAVSFLDAIDITVQDKTTMTTSCDGISALRQVGKVPDRIRCSTKHVDLVSALADFWHLLKFDPHTEHVYGHRDETSDNLTVPERLNCRMDLLAKSIALAYIEGPRRPISFHCSDRGIGTVKCMGKLVTSRIQHSLYDIITHDGMTIQLCDAMELDPDTFDSSVDWPSFRRARRSSKPSRKRFITKWISGNTATGRVMLNRQRRPYSNCPICQEEDEHLVHVLTCPHRDSLTLRTTLVDALKAWLIKEHTHPDVTAFLLQGLTSWFNDPYGNEILLNCADPTSQSTLLEQLELGWFATLSGFLHPNLIELQHRYYLIIRRRKTGRKWASNLIKQFWNIIHSLWVNRCSVLHNSDAIHRLHGLPLLRDAIEAEYNRGIGDMPHSYRSYFYTPLYVLLKQSPHYLKGWFLVIRSGRECYHLENTEDLFFTNTTLRAWIGLAPLE